MSVRERLAKSDALVEIANAANRASQIDTARAEEAKVKGDSTSHVIFLAAAQANITLAAEILDSAKMDLGINP